MQGLACPSAGEQTITSFLWAQPVWACSGKDLAGAAVPSGGGGTSVTISPSLPADPFSWVLWATHGIAGKQELGQGTGRGVKGYSRQLVYLFFFHKYIHTFRIAGMSFANSLCHLPLLPPVQGLRNAWKYPKRMRTRSLCPSNPYNKCPAAQCLECWKTAPWLEMISVKKKSCPATELVVNWLSFAQQNAPHPPRWSMLKEAWPGLLRNIVGHVWQAKALRDSKMLISGQPRLFAYVAVM